MMEITFMDANGEVIYSWWMDEKFPNPLEKAAEVVKVFMDGGDAAKCKKITIDYEM